MIDISQPIPHMDHPWNWDAISHIPIANTTEHLVSLSYIPERLLTSPQYHLQHLPGALPDLLIRQSLQERLVTAAHNLPYGHKFVIFDGWRSTQTQEALFNRMKQLILAESPDLSETELISAAQRIVALPSIDPAKPSPHSTGGAIDLSIVDNRGLLLDMGSSFDDITLAAKTTYYEDHSDLPNAQTIQQNRRLLYHTLTSVGFTNYPEEWWHFDFGNQNWAWSHGEKEAHFGEIVPSFPWISL